ncbi:hypothetical protein LIER_24103 [Lithospermum erythrorhizon]|uniref:RRM domain-containing protein n=1 Tax=Lithospermum erythrorhizon TaxID=34254 RepID=A0AAV3QZZ0_LITER
MAISNNGSNSNGQNLNMGDTTLTKVFVGGLAWETQREAMRAYFEKFGEILEAVIILDKASGRSKGYGFVTFKEAEAAKKACEDASPMINGRRANCNLASLGAKRPRATTQGPRPTSPQQGPNVARQRANASPAPANHVQWYYPPPPSQFHHHHQPLPFYGYPPAYITPDMTYNHVST